MTFVDTPTIFQSEPVKFANATLSPSCSTNSLSSCESTKSHEYEDVSLHDNSNNVVDPRHILAERFKTKMCRNYLETGVCPYEARCMFSHGPHDLRTTAMNVRDGLFTEEAIKAFRRAMRLMERSQCETAQYEMPPHSYQYSSPPEYPGNPANYIIDTPEYPSSYDHEHVEDKSGEPQTRAVGAQDSSFDTMVEATDTNFRGDGSGCELEGEDVEIASEPVTPSPQTASELSSAPRSGGDRPPGLPHRYRHSPYSYFCPYTAVY